MNKEKALIRKALMEEKVGIVLKTWYKLPTKVSQESIAARQEGNKLFKKCNHTSQTHERIWKYYSESIARAPTASEELALAYGNRSAFLLHIQKFQDSANDIDRALIITGMNYLKVKLLCRKVQCFSALGINGIEDMLEQAKYWFDKAEQKHKVLLIKTIEKAVNVVKNYPESLFQRLSSKTSINKNSISSTLHSEEILQVRNILKHKESVDPFDTVCLKHSEKYGRHLIANRDIKPGEIINVSRPYVTALNLNNFYAFCGHCLRTSWANIPCDYCNWCMFCSETCKNEAWNRYHDIECHVIPYIMFNQTSDYCKQLSLKLTVMSVREAGSIENLKKELEKIDHCQNKLQKGFVNKKLQENGFKSIYSLSSNVSNNALQMHLDHAVLTLIILAKSTAFFGKNINFYLSDDLLKNEDVLFIGSLILKFLKVSDINAHCVMEGSSTCRFSNSIETCQINRCCERGACLDTVPSFLNHSCYPTVRKCFTEDMQLVIYALQPVKKHNQLFDCYIGSFFEKPYAERKIDLQQFNFECECLPCKKQWPTAFELCSYLHVADDNTSEIEASLLEKHQALIECRDGELFNLNALDILSKDIEEAKNRLLEPSGAISTLISTLWTGFDYIYGMTLKVTDKCSNI